MFKSIIRDMVPMSLNDFLYSYDTLKVIKEAPEEDSTHWLLVGMCYCDGPVPVSERLCTEMVRLLKGFAVTVNFETDDEFAISSKAEVYYSDPKTYKNAGKGLGLDKLQKDYYEDLKILFNNNRFADECKVSPLTTALKNLTDG